MDGGINESYFYWLCSIVNADDPDESFCHLLWVLFNREFYWSVEHDDNRAADGLLLREDYANAEMVDIRELGMSGSCTVLEMLVALACRINDELLWAPNDDRTASIFWEMLANLGFDGLSDEYWRDQIDGIYVDEKVSIWLDREYSWSGEGGIFPLKAAKTDQREVEIWYQANSYVIENFGAGEDFEDY